MLHHKFSGFAHSPETVLQAVAEICKFLSFLFYSTAQQGSKPSAYVIHFETTNSDAGSRVEWLSTCSKILVNAATLTRQNCV